MKTQRNRQRKKGQVRVAHENNTKKVKQTQYDDDVFMNV